MASLFLFSHIFSSNFAIVRFNGQAACYDKVKKKESKEETIYGYTQTAAVNKR